jgi:hypothetical protein
MLWFSQSSSSNSCAKAKCLLMKATSCARQVTAQGSWPAAVNIPILNCVDCDESQPSCMVGSRPQVTWGTWISHGYHITWHHQVKENPYTALCVSESAAGCPVWSETKLELTATDKSTTFLSLLSNFQDCDLKKTSKEEKNTTKAHPPHPPHPPSQRHLFDSPSSKCAKIWHSTRHPSPGDFRWYRDSTLNTAHQRA